MKTLVGLCALFFLTLLLPLAGESVSLAAQNDTNAIVPNVTGIPSDVAMQILQIAGFYGKIQRGSGRSSIVNSQDPGAGALSAVGSEIVLAVGESAAAVTSEPVIANVATEEPSNMGMTVAATTPTPAPTQQTQTSPKVILSQQSSYTYVQSSDLQMRTFMAWYPKQFLTQSRKAQSDMFVLKQQPSGSSNIFQAKPLNAISGDQLPIIMTNTVGWQYGWVPYGSYAPAQNVLTSGNSVAGSGSSIQSVQESVQRQGSVSVPPVVRLLLSDAERAFKRVGLSIGNIYQVEDSKTGSGMIQKQAPAGRSFVPVGTKIDLWVVR